MVKNSLKRGCLRMLVCLEVTFEAWGSMVDYISNQATTPKHNQLGPRVAVCT